MGEWAEALWEPGRAVPGQTAAPTAVGAEPGTSVKFIVMVAGLFFDGLEPPSMA